MSRATHTSKRRSRKEAVPVLGAVGILSLAGGASAATAVPATDVPSRPTTLPQITLNEEELGDVSLGTFYVFDRENAGPGQLGEQIARGCGGCHGCGGGGGCRGCGGGRGCGGRGCVGGGFGGGCRGCGGGCGGCGFGCGGCGCGSVCIPWWSPLCIY
jgi:hypothetical protein